MSEEVWLSHDGKELRVIALGFGDFDFYRKLFLMLNGFEKLGPL